jgi:hypothetical protein
LIDETCQHAGAFTVSDSVGLGLAWENMACLLLSMRSVSSNSSEEKMSYVSVSIHAMFGMG